MTTKEKYGLLLLLLVQLLVCLPVLTAFPIGLDEPFSIFHSQKELSDLMEIFKGENNPPLHFLLLHFWIKIFGISAFAVRGLSVIFSLVTVGILFKVGRKFLKLEFAFILVLFFIFSRWNHYISVEARMYSIFIAFYALVFLDLYRFIFEDNKYFWRLAIWNALLIYTHYLGGIVIMIELLLFLLYFKKLDRKKWLYMLASGLITAILFIPGIRNLLIRVDDYTQTGTWVPEPHLADLWTNFVKLMNNQFALFSTIALLAAFYVINNKKSQGDEAKITEKRDVQKTWFKYALLWFTFIFFGFLVVSYAVQPVFFIKYIAFATIPLFVLITIVIQRFSGKFKPLWAFVFVVPFVLSFKIVPDTNRETNALVSIVKESKDESTLVVYSPPHYIYTLAYHYDRDIFRNTANPDDLLNKENVFGIYSFEDIPFSSRYDKLIYIDFNAEFIYPGNNILKGLDEHAVFRENKVFKGDFVVYWYGLR